MHSVITRSASGWCVSIALLACADGAPIDPSVGDPCMPSIVPCGADGNDCGFRTAEWYVDRQSTQCSNVCVVRMLDNGSAGTVPADPRLLCTPENPPANCVTQAAIDEAMYCSCRCSRSDTGDRDDLCTCGSGFQCEPFGRTGDSYCVAQPR